MTRISKSQRRNRRVKESMISDRKQPGCMFKIQFLFNLISMIYFILALRLFMLALQATWLLRSLGLSASRSHSWSLCSLALHFLQLHSQLLCYLGLRALHSHLALHSLKLSGKKKSVSIVSKFSETHRNYTFNPLRA